MGSLLRKNLFFCCLALKCFFGLKPPPLLLPLPGILTIIPEVKRYSINVKGYDHLIEWQGYVHVQCTIQSKFTSETSQKYFKRDARQGTLIYEWLTYMCRYNNYHKYLNDIHEVIIQLHQENNTKQFLC